MITPPPYYFVRANGHAVHNDPSKADCYVPGEPPPFPQDAYDHVQYCLGYDVARLGWPGTGDLRRLGDIPEFTPCYGKLPPRTRAHLCAFKAIAPGAGALMPATSRPGVLYAGDVTLPYSYFHEVPHHPFECAHRVGVRWDREAVTGLPAEYRAADFGISARGGWWRWPFHHLTPEKHGELIARIDAVRKARQVPRSE